MMRIVLLVACLLAHVALARAGEPPPPPDLLARAGIDQRLGAQLPLAAYFTDAHGTIAPLSHWLDGKPTVLMLGYFHCPNLCSVTQQAMAHALSRGGLRAGTDVSVIFLNIDPHDAASDAAAAQQQLLRSSGAADTAAWHFLIGDEAAIHAIARAIGYRYDYDANLKQYVHPSGAVIVGPDGTISQYLMGMTFEPRTVRLALVGASHHAVGSVVDQLVLLCCGYDPTTGRYTLAIVQVMQGLGVVFLALAAALWLGLRSRQRGAPE
jgi:protein SCO1/2